MAKDENGLHIQTGNQFEVQVEHLTADLGKGDPTKTGRPNWMPEEASDVNTH